MPERTMETGGQELAGEIKAGAEQARQKVAEQFGTGKSSATRELRGFAQALRKTAQHCDEQQQPAIASYARRAAEGVERLGDVLERKDLSEIFADFERLSRERPVAVGAAALLAGFLGARVARTAAGTLRERREDGGEPARSAAVEEAEAELEVSPPQGGGV